jgi:hypothetical protein
VRVVVGDVMVSDVAQNVEKGKSGRVIAARGREEKFLTFATFPETGAFLARQHGMAERAVLGSVVLFS